MSGPRARGFWEQVAFSDGCWDWTGTYFGNGYGRACHERKSLGAHRRSWEMTYGAIPDGKCVCHRCDNKGCVRPSHLFLGTQADNMRDMVAKGRSRAGSRNHRAKLTEADATTIRERYAAGGITQSALADEYGVVEGCIWNVLHYRVYQETAA